MVFRAGLDNDDVVLTLSTQPRGQRDPPIAAPRDENSGVGGGALGRLDDHVRDTTPTMLHDARKSVPGLESSAHY